MLLHINGKNNNTVQSENSMCSNDIQNIQAQEVKIEKDNPKISDKYTLSDDDLIEYMYQHVQFDEIPFDVDPLYDHRQIYLHDMSHIEYGLL